MPRFYLHLCNGTGFTEDAEGKDYPNVDAARADAITALRDVLAGEMKQGQLLPASFIEVEDENHNLVLTVAFADAVIVAASGERPARSERDRSGA
jgi:uncharacterized protein DUF6894